MSAPPLRRQARACRPSGAARACRCRCVPCPSCRRTTAADGRFFSFPPRKPPMTVTFSKDLECIDAGGAESGKAAAAVYMPVSGEITAGNESLRAGPSLANSDPLGPGWFFKIRLSDASQLDALPDAASYADYAKTP